MEAPFHPRELGNYIDPNSAEYNPLKFDAIVEGYKMRIDVVRELVPNCKIGLYGFPTPHAHGKADSAVEVRRTMGYELAAAQGILDQVDTICPVLYQRFGATDSTTTASPTTCRSVWTQVAPCVAATVPPSMYSHC